jgi:thiol:disulfide interchange protein DsbD
MRLEPVEVRRPLFRILCVFLTFGAALVAGAQMSHAKWTAEIRPTDVHAGESAQIVLTAKIDADWHLYQLKQVAEEQVKQAYGPSATAFTLAPSKGVEAQGEAIQPLPGEIFDQNFNLKVGEFEKAVAFALPVKVSANASGAQTVRVKANWQTCNAHLCMPPESQDLTVKFTVASGPARADHTAALTAPPTQPAGYSATTSAAPGGVKQDGATADVYANKVQDAQKQGLLPFFALAFVAGLAALLTPCVFPMIPITVSYFAKATNTDKKVNFGGAIAYCVGIIGTFTVLGLLVSAIFGATGVQALGASPYLNLAFAVVFVVLAINLFGVFELRLPSGLVNKAHAGSRKGGFFGPMMMGLTFTLTTFTCTVPFVGTVLGNSASSTTPGGASLVTKLFPVVGMFGFSLAFALPFFVLALFPQFLGRLPKSGSWLNTVKGFMAFLELAAALKFLSNADLSWQTALLTRPVFLAIWAIIGTLAALYLLGLFVIGETNTAKPGFLRLAFGVLMVASAFGCLAGVNGRSLGEVNAFLPPDPYPGQKAGAGDIQWLPKYDGALAQAKSQSRPLFVDFTGVTCTNCRWMEQNMFTRPEVRKLIDGYVPVELYTDRPTADDQGNKKLEQQLANDITLPMYVLMSPEGKVLKIFQGSTRDSDEFIAFLKAGQASTVASR